MFFCCAPLSSLSLFLSFWLFSPFPFSSASFTFSCLILFSTNFRWFWWTSFWIVVFWGIMAQHLETSFTTISKSVHHTVHVISDVGENLWKRDYFTIVLPVYLQVAMGRSTKGVSPVTTERGQKIKIPNFRFSSLPSPIFGRGFKLKKYFNKKMRIGTGLAKIYLKGGFLWMLPYHPATEKLMLSQVLSSFSAAFSVTFQADWSIYTTFNFLYWHQLESSFGI